MSPAETGMWVDGEQLVRWLAYLRAIDLDHLDPLGERLERLVRACLTEGRRPYVYTVDKLLCHLEIPLGLMPEEFYCENPRAGVATTKVTPEMSHRIASLRRLDWSFGEIAAMVGVAKRTAERHVRKAGLA